MTKSRLEEIKAEEIQEIERFIKHILYAFEVPRRRNYINDDTGNYVSKGESRDRVLYILSTIAVVLVVLSINLTGIFFIKFTSGNSHDDLSISTGRWYIKEFANWNVKDVCIQKVKKVPLWI